MAKHPTVRPKFDISGTMLIHIGFNCLSYLILSCFLTNIRTNFCGFPEVSKYHSVDIEGQSFNSVHYQATNKDQKLTAVEAGSGNSRWETRLLIGLHLGHWHCTNATRPNKDTKWTNVPNIRHFSWYGHRIYGPRHSMPNTLVSPCLCFGTFSPCFYRIH